MNNYWTNQKNWTPKGISFIGFIALGVLFIFNKSTYKIHFLDWSIAAFVLFILVLYFIIRGKIKTRELLFFLVPLLWTGYAILVTPFAFNPGHHISWLFLVMALSLLACGLIVTVFTDPNAGKAIAWISSLWVLINVALFLLWHLNKIEYYGNNFSGLFNNRNSFSLQTVILLSLTIFYVKKSKWRIGIILSSIFLILVSQSITGFISMIFILVFPKFHHANLKTKFNIIIISVLAIILTLILVDGIAERINRFLLVFSDPNQLSQNESAFLRSWLFNEGFKLFFQHPITGIGVDNARFFLIPPKGFVPPGIGLVSHSNYLEMLLNVGIPGFILHYGVLFYIYYKTKLDHPYAIAIHTFIMLYLLTSFTAITYSQFSTVFLFSMPVFLFYSTQKDKRLI